MNSADLPLKFLSVPALRILDSVVLKLSLCTDREGTDKVNLEMLKEVGTVPVQCSGEHFFWFS